MTDLTSEKDRLKFFFPDGCGLLKTPARIENRYYEKGIVLDEYMKTRDNLPGKGVTGAPLVPDPKTSEEIAGDLQPMYSMDISVIAKYMFLHEFTTTTVEDGTVKWAIWRDMDFQV